MVNYNNKIQPECYKALIFRDDGEYVSPLQEKKKGQGPFKCLLKVSEIQNGE